MFCAFSTVTKLSSALGLLRGRQSKKEKPRAWIISENIAKSNGFRGSSTHWLSFILGLYILRKIVLKATDASDVSSEMNLENVSFISHE